MYFFARSLFDLSIEGPANWQEKKDLGVSGVFGVLGVFGFRDECLFLLCESMSAEIR